VIGTGYLGAVHSACLAELGFEVLGLDRDPERVAALARGEPPFYEPGLADLLHRHTVGTGRLRFTTSYAEVAEVGDVHFLCVGTPQREADYAADLSHLDAAVAALAPLLHRPCLVVGKSTVPVGTARRIASVLTASAPAGGEVGLVWNPEFLREGHALQDTLRPDRLVVGVGAPDADRVLREVYASLIADGVPLLVTDLETAELAKTAANAFLATKISFINAMAEICEATGADVTLLADVLGHDPRIGRSFLSAGLGFGGGCLPKDLRGFLARAQELGVDSAGALLREVEAINQRQRSRTVALAREQLGGEVSGCRIAVLGAAFKPGSDDIRDSPALTVAAELHRQGARVLVYDPQAVPNARRLFPALEYAHSAVEACADADLVLHLTDWPEFCELDPHDLSGLVAQRRILDARNALDPQRWLAAGWAYRALGRRG
jgi:UDPglucose 6-dehydrogenase